MEIKDNELLRQFEVNTEEGLIAIEYSLQERKIFLTKFCSNGNEDLDFHNEFIKNVLDIAESKKLALFSYYNKGMITVKNPKAEAGVVSIYSLNGVEVNRFNISKTLTEMPATFKKGIYIINVKTETERFTGKFSVL